MSIIHQDGVRSDSIGFNFLIKRTHQMPLVFSTRTWLSAEFTSSRRSRSIALRLMNYLDPHERVECKTETTQIKIGSTIM